MTRLSPFSRHSTGRACLAVFAAALFATFTVVVHRWRAPEVVLAPLGATTSEYVGAARCAQCHQEISDEQSCSRMATTLHTAEEYERRHPLPVPAEVLDSANQLRYRILRHGGKLWLEAWRGREVARAEMTYALGSGKVAVTFVRELDAENYEELRASFYADTNAWDLTPGQHGARPATVTEALGRPIGKRGEKACLTCHASLLVQSRARIDIARSLFGVDCERCHGPGREHVESALAGTPSQLRPPAVAEALRVVQQGRERNGPQTPQEELLRSVAQSNDERLIHDLYVCGECHGYQQLWHSSSEDELTKFQVAALVGSPCYQRSRTKIRCSDCHDAHGDSPGDGTIDYAAVCVRCHSQQVTTRFESEARGLPNAESKLDSGQSIRICPINSEEGCIACHMPIRSPISHAQFTHHRIGIYRDR